MHPCRYVQQEASLRSPSPCSPFSVEGGEGEEEGRERLLRQPSMDFLPGHAQGNPSLLSDAQELIKFIAQRCAAA